MKKEKIFNNLCFSGIIVVLLNLLILAGGIVILFIIPDLWWLAGVLVFIHLFLWFGMVLIEPNEACAMLLFGKYQGTLKENGFFFVNPFLSKTKLSQRAHNLDVNPIKVNDKQGNPIMIGLVLVWKIDDTYKALFEIEVDKEADSEVMQRGQRGGTLVIKYKKVYDRFVKVQSDAALRKIAGLYSYDYIDNDHQELTLRGGGDEINHHLESELQDRLLIAGIEIIEARINYLAYSPEIAGAMLRRQQATAIISAREKIVEGAVSMVQLALRKLAEDKIVDLDEDKKAAMVSNLLVVLCADDSVQPVINTGTLHQ